MIQYSHDIQTESRANKMNDNVAQCNMKTSTPITGFQVDLQTRKRSIIDRVGIEVDNAIATVETNLHEAILSTRDDLVTPGVELVVKMANASPDWDPGV